MELVNKAMLVTYADSLSGSEGLGGLRSVIDKHFSKVIGGVHLLPFYPSSADRGFAPLSYDEIDPAFGSWKDIRELSDRYYLMSDFMVNHISRRSRFFGDFLAKGEKSQYANLFIDYEAFWGGEPSEEDYARLHRRKPRAPYIEASFSDGRVRKIWCTFGEEQIDLNVANPDTKKFIMENLKRLTERGISLIRLDAIGYATKRPGTACFFVEPDIWELLQWIEGQVEPLGARVLPEVHRHHSVQMKMSHRGYWTYDFALPMLVLYTLHSGSARRLSHWLSICPRQQFTTLDTHDGIGVIDVEELLSPEEIDFTKKSIYSRGANVKPEYNTISYNNLDIYQINSTYYSALGDSDKAYLLARAIQFFAPGIPQVYYVGLLAGRNDIELLEKTKEGRNINRHYFTQDEIEKELERPVVRSLLRMMEFRNDFPAFAIDSTFTVENDGDENLLAITREHDGAMVRLEADCRTWDFRITYRERKNGLEKTFEI